MSLPSNVAPVPHDPLCLKRTHRHPSLVHADAGEIDGKLPPAVLVLDVCHLHRSIDRSNTYLGHLRGRYVPRGVPKLLEAKMTGFIVVVVVVVVDDGEPSRVHLLSCAARYVDCHPRILWDSRFTVTVMADNEVCIRMSCVMGYDTT